MIGDYTVQNPSELRCSRWSTWVLYHCLEASTFFKYGDLLHSPKGWEDLHKSSETLWREVSSYTIHKNIIPDGMGTNIRDIAYELLDLIIMGTADMAV
jgi:hypothetical protein